MKIAIAGCAGRMGRALLLQALETPGCDLIGGTIPKDRPQKGKDLGLLAGGAPIGISATDAPEDLFAHADVVIDFTTPDALLTHLGLAQTHKTALVIGTTALQKIHFEALEKAAHSLPIVQATNMSVGMNLLFALVTQAAEKLDPSYDIEIYERHHRHKADAPSGTLWTLGHAAAKGRGINLEDNLCLSYSGDAQKREEGKIGFSISRGGGVFGDHDTAFVGENEVVTLSHHALNRCAFAQGALKAALWLKDQPPGHYTMRDVLGIG